MESAPLVAVVSQVTEDTDDWVADESDDTQRVETTVFELAGQDKAGLLAEVTSLLTSNGCNVRSAAVSCAVTCAVLIS